MPASRERSGTPKAPVPRKATRPMPPISRRSPLDARGRLFLNLAALGDADQLVQRLEVVDVEDAVQVVDLVLQGAREEFLALHPEFLAVTVPGFHGDLGGAT